ncbi:hypothetical protein DTI93_09135 [Parasaccharibacter sp. TMW 2.1884]|uniref:phage GP46 family protein n=1 Tax=Parasaccharibacter sp. TMW 2.1884 TaxID=2267834 RepID=UPI0020134A98|nr:phage GP46 family protein [Parasaccharibacter sp. TMW 2.1884]MCL1512545.1 hypothetical protein [Parasaccharibacter sp. TMW 2.1884]
MADIALTFDSFTQAGDLLFSDGDVALENPLKTALLISLFSDRLAPDQLTAQDRAVGVLPPGSAVNSALSPRRGWWGDSIDSDLIGSRLWQLKRIVRTGSSSVLREIEAVVHEALAWMQADGIVDRTTVLASWAAAADNTVSLVISLTEPGAGSGQSYQFTLAWNSIHDAPG